MSSRSGFIVDANNFTSGLLPDGVESVEYYNSSPKVDVNNEVIANIILSDDFNIGKNDCGTFVIQCIETLTDIKVFDKSYLDFDIDSSPY